MQLGGKIVCSHEKYCDDSHLDLSNRHKNVDQHNCSTLLKMRFAWVLCGVLTGACTVVDSVRGMKASGQEFTFFNEAMAWEVRRVAGSLPCARARAQHQTQTDQGEQHNARRWVGWLVVCLHCNVSLPTCRHYPPRFFSSSFLGC